MTTDPNAYIEVLARLLCAADVHVHDGDHPTWQQLRVAEHGRGQDDYRKAARWLQPKLTVAAETRLSHAERRCDKLRAESKRRGKTVLEQSEKIRALEREVDGLQAQLGAEILQAAPAVPEAAPPTGQTGLRDRIAALFRHPPGVERLGDATPGEIADAVLSVLPADAELHRLALSTALGLGTSAPWDAIRARAAELAGQDGAGDDEGDELVCVDECGLCDACGMEPFDTPAEGWREAARFLRRTARTSGNREGALHGARLIETELRRLAAETPGPETQPRRGDAFEQWLKAQRDLCFEHAITWGAVDGLLDQYRLHADTGTPLGEHVCEGRVAGDCECLETPTAETPDAPRREPHPTEADVRHALAVAAKFHGQAATASAVVAEPGKEG